ncbi:MAG TPA: MerR family transcriptional regulator [Candidatus Polarisedimenticolaceae bacterium]|nr:MerR family transcriptional regulator [Candidatus Polarisedimenticolaceae bacterium]
MREIPQKSYYRIGEVCELTDTQPYVLRFWESEFPQLHREKSGPSQRVYTREDVETVLRIKQLLYDEEYTIAGARRRLEQEQDGEVVAQEPEPSEADAPAAPAEPVPVAPAPLLFEESAGVPRDRYEDAVEEIAHLRLQLKEAELRTRRIEQTWRKEQEGAGQLRERLQRVTERVERLLDQLS